jgi:hypothetical protein
MFTEITMRLNGGSGGTLKLEKPRTRETTDLGSPLRRLRGGGDESDQWPETQIGFLAAESAKNTNVGDISPIEILSRPCPDVMPVQDNANLG